MPQFQYREPESLCDGTVSLALKAYTEEVEEGRLHVPFYEFYVIDAATGEAAGGLVLRAGYNDHVTFRAGNIGYGISEGFRGRGYAARACRLVERFAASLGMPYLVITTRPDNYASGRTALNAGYSYAGTFTVPEEDEMYREGERSVDRYVLMLARDCRCRNA
ncbi:MAG TPA: GNAT family N-acetyltransferase [Bacillota bacterium]|nr:GNAT family N-acetyltransferase [Bacillota bacterium]HOA16117.1 GNAT family N-acetyltransferase [Bacillota bacterium]HOG52901.1 GNAT family N-acetyltransferase [Bacillota bacterium]